MRWNHETKEFIVSMLKDKRAPMPYTLLYRGKCSVTGGSHITKCTGISTLDKVASTRTTYIITQKQRYSHTFLQKEVYTYIKKPPKNYADSSKAALMQCNRTKQLCCTNLPGFQHCTDSHRIGASPSVLFCTSLWCYIHRLCQLTENTANLQATNKTLHLLYLILWGMFL